MNDDQIKEVLDIVPKGYYDVVFGSSNELGKVRASVEIWERDEHHPNLNRQGQDKRPIAFIFDRHLSQRQATALGVLFAGSKKLAEEVMFLRSENFALTAWQCPYTDGVTGLTSDDHGNSYCSMAKRNEALAARNKELADALKVAREVFISYAEMHAAKPDLEKAKRNYEHSLAITLALGDD